jgi:hypothetical protein
LIVLPSNWQAKMPKQHVQAELSTLQNSCSTQQLREVTAKLCLLLGKPKCQGKNLAAAHRNFAKSLRSFACYLASQNAKAAYCKIAAAHSNSAKSLRSFACYLASKNAKAACSCSAQHTATPQKTG